MKFPTLSALLAACALSSAAIADDAADFDAALAERYRAVEAAIEARDGARWFRELYDDDIVLTGEGSPAAVRGRAALMPVIAEIVRTTRSCTLTPDPARGQSGALGYSFVTYDCAPDDASAPRYQVRALFVWARKAPGWRVVAETYLMGRM
ncbi:nuclear transport factor 2 family protein [Thauera aromatica]|uniref:nuclear transport factor 2 family protein n=1 Tax=Thauera aromatica TaxID=59405 RepID=UPI001FFCC32E|nr:nuclear transport factor 2 family protein [Thauera aromatica]MCK2086800.1 nuclear transport factor 2 family protein [Thauera aromatica]